MIKSDRWIREMSQRESWNGTKMIEPFAEFTEDGVISYGVSSYGYDLRLAEEFLVYTGVHFGGVAQVIDPKHFTEDSFMPVTAKTCIIPGNTFALAKAIEYIKMPRTIIGLLVDKSTYRRCGIHVSGTVFEPGWEGIPTLEISNTTPNPIKVYANEGICQLIFMQATEDCDVSYADRDGKYQGQREITLPKVRNIRSGLSEGQMRFLASYGPDYEGVDNG